MIIYKFRVRKTVQKVILVVAYEHQDGVGSAA